MSQAEGAPVIRVAPSPHLIAGGMTARRMMVDVLVGLAPLVGMALFVFGWYALWILALCAVSCLAAEAGFSAWRGKKAQLDDFSALVTGLILGLSLPWSAPWYAAVLASVVAIGIGKIAFGGLGQNLFNPAMVGRAFAMVCFPAALGAAAYRAEIAGFDAVARATPLTAVKQLGETTDLVPLLLGTVNGSLGETSALACLLGGAYLCLRRAASWQIPVGVVLSVAVLAGMGDLLGSGGGWTALHHLAGGALLFGAFFIATDPVSSPLTKKGKWIYGVGIGALVILLRLFSGYPEGVMFAVLLMNAAVPLINRWTIPRPVGGPVPAKE